MTSANSLLNAARAALVNDTFALDVTGVTIDEVGDGSAVCSLAVNERHLNARGVVMGGAVFTLADLAFAAAANSQCFADNTPLCWTTMTSQISFLAPALPPRLTARCQAVARLHKVAHYRTDIFDADGSMVATVSATAFKLHTHVPIT